MTIATNGPASGYTTAYPLPMIQDNSIYVTHASIEIISTAAHTIDMAIYLLDWKNRLLTKVPSSTVTFDCAILGVQTKELSEKAVLLPKVQYFLGFCPTGGTYLRVLGATVAPWKVAGATISDTLSIDTKQTKAWTALPWAELLSTKGTTVL